MLGCRQQWFGGKEVGCKPVHAQSVCRAVEQTAHEGGKKKEKKVYFS